MEKINSYLYNRVNTEQHEQSLEDQQHLLINYALKQGYEIISTDEEK